MKVTKRTKTALVLPLLTTDEEFDRVVKAMPRVELDTPVLSMTIGQFIEASDDKYIEILLKEKRAYKALGRIRAWSEDLEGVYRFIQKMEIRPSATEKKASMGILFPSFQERMLIDCIDWFHLHSMSEAENVKLADYLVMLKGKSASDQYQRNYNDIISKKQ